MSNCRAQTTADPGRPVVVLVVCGVIGYHVLREVAEQTPGPAPGVKSVLLAFSILAGYMLLGHVVKTWYFGEAGRVEVGWLFSWPVLLPIVVVIDRLRDDGETHAG